MRENSDKRVPLKGCALYGVRSPRRLSYIMCADIGLMYHIAQSQKNYLEFDMKGRWIENPKPALKRIQARFAFLLAQIETPEYLHSAVKGRSYITNASKHKAVHGAIKTDVRKFYPSARASFVNRFLVEELCWAKDVAWLMTNLLTLRGHLPTGGNASPILSYWAYKPMFDEVARLAEEHGCVFTLYVDDMTLSGEFANRRLIHEARKVVGRFGLQAHKSHFFEPGRPRVITGVAQTRSGRKLPLRRQKLIRDGELQLRAASSDEERLAILRPLLGRIFEAVEIDGGTWRGRAAELSRLKNGIERKRLSQPAVTPRDPSVELIEDDGTPPWDDPRPSGPAGSVGG